MEVEFSLARRPALVILADGKGLTSFTQATQKGAAGKSCCTRRRLGPNARRSSCLPRVPLERFGRGRVRGAGLFPRQRCE
jgi:hypothetical protein